MSAASYQPGAWVGVVRAKTAVVLGPDAPTGLAAALWDLLAKRPQVHEILHAVTGSAGGSLADIPAFGIVDFTGPLRVFLRGPLDLAVQSSQGTVDLDGRDVTTWNERRFEGAERCQLTISDVEATDVAELPLVEGVVLLRSLTLTLSGAPGEADSAAGIGGPVLVPAVLPGSALPAAATPQSVAAAVVPEPNAPTLTHAVQVPSAAPSQEGTTGDEAEAPQDPDAAGQAVAAAIPLPATDPVQDGDVSEEVADLGITIMPDHGLAAEPEASDGQTTASVGQDVEPSANGTAEEVASSAEPVAAPDEEPADSPASEFTSSYDHLWERTVMRNIEDAAVREDPDAEPATAPDPATNQEPAAEAPEQDSNPDQAHATDVPAPDNNRNLLTSAEPAAAAPVAAKPAGLLIDSVPWRTGSAAPTKTPDTSSAPSAPKPAASIGVGTSADVAPASPATDAAAEDFGDHDGQTVMKSSLKDSAAPSSGPGGAGSAASPADPGKGPVVLARVCAQRHANPPTRSQCAACGAALLPDAIQVARPRLGRMRVSTGELVDLDQSLIVGRQPSVSRVQGAGMPRLVQVASPEGDISRSHVEVRLEGWHVMLCDLKATNGTVLVREGQPPRRLAQNEMAILLDGDIAELGEGISLRFEEIL